jgi:glycosyltransferase involved in cell wall biosynthesis/predicted  nucleic acid-binding Zn-ribbon protein
MERMNVHTAEVTRIDDKAKAKPEPSLERLYAEHDGKVADKWSSYLREYDRVFRDLRERPVRVLEIGIQNGGSLDRWARFFSNAQCIIGCDIDPNCGVLRYDDPRIAVVIGDANTDETQGQIAELATALDIIIDDGSHRSSDIIRSFARYFPLLSADGLFIVEDLHCSYWKEFEGGLFHPHAAMTFLKRLADVINHEHWGVPRFRADFLCGVSEQYGVEFHDQDLGHIHSIEFCNSLCVIRKAPSDENMLGTRITVGSSEQVTEGILRLHGQRRPDRLDQSDNVWSQSAVAPEDELTQKRAEIAALETRLAAVDAEISAVKEQLSLVTGELSATREQRDDVAATTVSLHDQIAALITRCDAQVSEHARFRAALTQRELQVVQASTVIADLSSSMARLEQEQRAIRRARDDVRKKLSKAEGALNTVQKQLKSLEHSLSWQLTKPLRGARKVLRERGMSGSMQRMFQLLTRRPKLVETPAQKTAAPKRVTPPAPEPRLGYTDWLHQYDTLKSEGRAALAARAAAFLRQPLVSVVLMTCEPNLDWLEDAVESVRAQIYPHWELWVIDDASTNPALRLMLDRLASQDPRIQVRYRVSRSGSAEATNAALELARGEWVAFVEQSDVLREQALYRLVEALNRNDELKLIYSDEDKVDGRGERSDPNFKPDWNPDLFLSCNMLGHLSAYSAVLLRELGGVREGFAGAEAYDLALRCMDRLQPRQIHHVPRVLYSARDVAERAEPGAPVKPSTLAGQRALNEHFQRTALQARAEIVAEDTFRVRYQLPQTPPLVSVIIPTRNAPELVRQCMESIFDRTTYPSYEVLLLDNGSDDPAALSYLSQLALRAGVRVVRDERPFNYSALNNMGVQLAHGEYVCLLNNDIEVMSPYWLEELIGIASQPGVGAVGARLWYPDDTLQHGGVIIGVHGIGGHAHKHLPKGNRGYHGRADMIQGYSVVTGACLAIKRSTYLEMDGLNESELKVAFNDVDLCLRLREAGYRNVWTPYANLYHHESATRGGEDTPEKLARFAREVEYINLRWATELAHDPAYNPNLSIAHEDFRLAWPPRV